jgi:hypothetical protein
VTGRAVNGPFARDVVIIAKLFTNTWRKFAAGVVV